MIEDLSSIDTIEFQLPFVGFQPKRDRSFSSLIKIDFGCASNVGKVRSNNEDAYLIFRAGRHWNRLFTSLHPDDLPETWEENSYGMGVADGMGGAAAGEIASKMALQTVVRLILQSPRWAIKLDTPETREEEIAAAKQRAEKYFRQIDAELSRHASMQPMFKGMGTTFTCGYSNGDDLFVIHTGDSRAYLLRQAKLQQLTQDQTVAQAMVRMGALTPEEAAKHYLRHTLTSCLGGSEGKIQLDIVHERLRDGDRLLLCTDGLNDMVKDTEIAEVLKKRETSQSICDRLVDMALAAGGVDNVTVVLASYSIPNRSETA